MMQTDDLPGKLFITGAPEEPCAVSDVYQRTLSAILSNRFSRNATCLGRPEGCYMQRDELPFDDFLQLRIEAQEAIILRSLMLPSGVVGDIATSARSRFLVVDEEQVRPQCELRRLALHALHIKLIVELGEREARDILVGKYVVVGQQQPRRNLKSGAKPDVAARDIHAG